MSSDLQVDVVRLLAADTHRSNLFPVMNSPPVLYLREPNY